MCVYVCVWGPLVERGAIIIRIPYNIYILFYDLKPFSAFPSYDFYGSLIS